MEVIKTGKLNAYIGPDNYIYTRSSARRNVTYFSCRKKDCLGRANVRNGEFKTTESHGHPVDLEQVKRFRFRHRLQMRAAEETLSIAEIYKQEANAIGGVPGLKLKSVNRGMYRARHGELPPPPKSINELATLLVDEKWKEKMLYSYGEDKEEFFKACLQSEDASTQVIFMSPTFEDFARTGAPLRLHMDSAFKIKPACGEGTEYVALHMYIGTILYPFVHMFTSMKSYYGYFSLMKYISDFIPNLNVEIFVSNDQESIEAAYTVFPKAVKSYYQPREKDKDSTPNKKDMDLNDVEMFNKEFTRRLWPKPGVWRFIETLKEIDYNKMSDFYKLRNKKVPNRYPTKKKEVEVQTEFNNEAKIKVNSEAQTIPPTNIKKYFSEFKPFLQTLPKGKTKRSYLGSSNQNVIQREVAIPKSLMKGDYRKLTSHLGISRNKPIVIKKIMKAEHNDDESPSKKFKTEESVQIEILLNPSDINQSMDSKKPIILRRNKKNRANLRTSKIEGYTRQSYFNRKSISNSIIQRNMLSKLSKQKLNDLRLIEKQLAEMEGSEILEEELEVDEEGKELKRKTGRKQKMSKVVEMEDSLNIKNELNDSEELNSDDGEIETLELSEEEQDEYESVEILEENNEEEYLLSDNKALIHINEKENENFDVGYCEELPHEMQEGSSHEEVIENASILYDDTEENDMKPILTNLHNHST